MTESAFVRLRRLIADELGARERSPIIEDLEGRIAGIARREGRTAESLAECLIAPGAPPSLLESMLDELTIGETWFFRDRALFRLLEERILPELGAGGRRISIWSAGCATGEEAHSLAFVAGRAVPGGAQLLGTDIDPARLAVARARTYPARSARGEALPPGFARALPGGYAVEPTARVQTDFAVHNLARQRAPGCFDLIVCRNVLLYFHVEALRFAFETFDAALGEGAWLVLGAHDVIDRPDRVPPSFQRSPVLPYVFRRVARRATAEEAPPVETPTAQCADAPRDRDEPPRRPIDRTRYLVHLARARLDADDGFGAEMACLEALDRTPNDTAAMLVLAGIALARGELNLARMLLALVPADHPERTGVEAGVLTALRARGKGD